MRFRTTRSPALDADERDALEQLVSWLEKSELPLHRARAVDEMIPRRRRKVARWLGDKTEVQIAALHKVLGQ